MTDRILVKVIGYKAFFGHAGRPGKVGGAAPRSGGFLGDIHRGKPQTSDPHAGSGWRVEQKRKTAGAEIIASRMKKLLDGIDDKTVIGMWREGMRKRGMDGVTNESDLTPNEARNDLIDMAKEEYMQRPTEPSLQIKNPLTFYVSHMLPHKD